MEKNDPELLYKLMEVEMLPRMKYSLPVFCLLVIIAFCTSVWAEDMQAIKQRMLQRKPTIDALKKSGALGEGADGYLHVKEAAGNAAAVAQAENNDRRTVNQMIAQKEGSTVELVARKASAFLINNSPPGSWVQKPDGTWHKK